MHPITDRRGTPAHQTHDDADRADTAVIGAGIGGLLAAVTAAKAAPGTRVVLIDPHPAGGRARCDDRAGFVFNRGPRALYPAAEAALRSVGVDTSPGSPPNLDGALALAAGTTHRFPAAATAAARTTLLTAREKAQVVRLAGAMWRADAAATDGRSVADWLDERGATGMPRQFIEALVRVSTYANAPDTFAAGPALANARTGIRPGVRYLDGGWQSLVDQLLALAADAGVEHVAASVAAVQPGERGAPAVVVASDGHRWEATSVVIAAGGPEAAAAILPGRPTSWGQLAPPVTAACLELGIRGLPAHRFALGIDEPLYGSTHCPPAELAPDGHAVVHLMRYQPLDDAMEAADQRARLEQLAATMGIARDQIVEERFLARMVVAGTLPHPGSGALAGRPSVAVPEHRGVFLAGDWVGPSGLLLDAVAASAVEAGRQAADRSATMARA